MAPLVDCHAHIFLRDMPVTPEAWTEIEYAFTAEDLLHAMDLHDVHFAVVAGLSVAGSYNDYTIEALRHHRRLRGTVIVPPATGRHTLERMRDDGIVGLRLQLARQDRLPDLLGDGYRMLFRHARDLDWHVHVAIEGPKLRPVLDALLPTGVKVVIDHFGHPDPKDPLNCDGYRAMIEAVASGRVWVKLSGGFRLPGMSAWRDDPDGDIDSIAALVAGDLVERVGGDRLLWGSDAPFVGYEKRLCYGDVLESFARWVPDRSVREQMSRTALKLYFS